MKKLFLSGLALLSLNSCAVGSAFSAYSLISFQSERLTSNGEQEIVDRTKEEIYSECQNRLDWIKYREQRMDDLEESRCTIILNVTSSEELSHSSK